MKTSKEVRQSYLDFFAQNQHKIFPSDSLIPKSDPSLLFTSAGMVQFKPYFLGLMGAQLKRAASCQKCFRTTDIENVGHTARHHTFFEMLGNFSFGDYFKEEAIIWAWEYVTQYLKLPIEKLWITVFRNDEEAARLWEDKAGVARDRIIALGEEDNFWQMGDTGPCGPCSEIHYDQGKTVGCGKPNCNVACDCDRFLELWNLVFTQYDRQLDGSLKPLPRKNIDTGMGLERVTAVLQGVPSNFETDLFVPLINKVEELSKKTYGKNEANSIAMRVLADHSRATTFAIADNIVPSNIGRGYVLRRIMRRAMRYGRLLGIEGPMFYPVVEQVAMLMGDIYPEVKERLPYIRGVVEAEEKAFLATLERGLNILRDYIQEVQASGQKELPAEKAFVLYDTYGFPYDLTRDVLSEEGLSCKEEEFSRFLEEQRKRARAAWKGDQELTDADLASQGLNQSTDYKDITLLSPTLKAWMPREEESIKLAEENDLNQWLVDCRIVSLLVDGQSVKKANRGTAVDVILSHTSFYAEAGGQVGDTGYIVARDQEGVMTVNKVQKTAAGIYIHSGKVTQGELTVGMPVKLNINWERRQQIALNHTATHLLHSALRQVLGAHIKQAGSLVEPDRLRFDFAHFQALSPGEIRAVEDLANQWVRKNLPIEVNYMPMDKAKQMGAIALFDEKYGEEVRVLNIGDVSIELCGGTHIHRSGDIGLIKIVSESSISAGVRRIEALTAEKAYTYLQNNNTVLSEIASLLKSPPEELPNRIEKLLSKIKEQEKQLQRLASKQAVSKADNLLTKIIEIKGVKVLALEVKVNNVNEQRQIMDNLREKINSGIILLASVIDNKIVFNCSVRGIPTTKGGIHAGELINIAAQVTGGGGGGKPERAQAGGREVEKLPQALEQFLLAIKERL